jgi:hypothetical protein
MGRVYGCVAAHDYRSLASGQSSEDVPPIDLCIAGRVAHRREPGFRSVPGGSTSCQVTFDKTSASDRGVLEGVAESRGAMATRFTELVGRPHPVQLAAMAGRVGGPDQAAAVRDAGGLGAHASRFPSSRLAASEPQNASPSYSPAPPTR